VILPICASDTMLWINRDLDANDGWALTSANIPSDLDFLG